jgi:glycosyltransferase involved in cell wall biosynthesis
LPRILHIIDSLGHTGTATQLRTLAEGLAREGFDVHTCALNEFRKTVFAPPKGRLKASPSIGDAPHRPPGSVHNVARRFSIDPLACWRLRRLIARLQPEIIHTWDAVAGMYGAMAIGSAGFRLVAGCYRIERYPPASQAIFERRLARRADRWVTNSPTVRDWYIARGLPAEKFCLISAGVACGVATGPANVAAGASDDLSRAELLRELNLPPDAKLIGVVGRLAPDKRVQDLIWAADLLRVLHNNLRLLVIGDGPCRRQLERYARLASDLEHIQFLGERSDVGRIMPHLDVLWNGSENRGQSMAILEAMAVGVPVIASDTPSNRELVVEGETGFLIPLGSRAGRAARARWTDRLLGDAEFRAGIGAAAQRRICEQFDSEEMVIKLKNVYGSL